MQNIEHENVFLFFSLDSAKIFLKESRQKTFVMLADFDHLRGWEVWVKPIKKDNL